MFLFTLTTSFKALIFCSKILLSTLNELFSSLASALKANNVDYDKESIYRDFRAGDVRHSQADISKAQKLLGYQPQFRIQQGIDKAMPWYVEFLSK